MGAAWVWGAMLLFCFLAPLACRKAISKYNARIVDVCRTVFNFYISTLNIRLNKRLFENNYSKNINSSTLRLHLILLLPLRIVDKIHR